MSLTHEVGSVNPQEHKSNVHKKLAVAGALGGAAVLGGVIGSKFFGGSAENTPPAPIVPSQGAEQTLPKNFPTPAGVFEKTVVPSTVTQAERTVSPATPGAQRTQEAKRNPTPEKAVPEGMKEYFSPTDAFKIAYPKEMTLDEYYPHKANKGIVLIFNTVKGGFQNNIVIYTEPLPQGWDLDIVVKRMKEEWYDPMIKSNYDSFGYGAQPPYLTQEVGRGKVRVGGQPAILLQTPSMPSVVRPIPNKPNTPDLYFFEEDAITIMNGKIYHIQGRMDIETSRVMGPVFGKILGSFTFLPRR